MRFVTSNLSVSFTPQIVPTLAALFAIGLTLYLANWQQGRAAEKRLLQAAFDTRTALPAAVLGLDRNIEPYRQATATGQYDVAGQFFLDNKSEVTTVGYHVITPLKLKLSDTYILVNRGFTPRSRDYPTPPAIDVPSGVIEVAGMLVSPTSKFIELGSGDSSNDGNSTNKAISSTAISGKVWQNLTIARYREQTKRDVIDLVLLNNVSTSQLKAVTERPDARVAKHVEYMLTWYSLAATVMALWLVLNTKFNCQKNLK
jgi:surfeit locus 1 family protein